MRVSEQQPYQVREYVWCLNVPPRCSKYKIMFKTVYKTQNLVKTRPVEDCCKGYTKSNTEDRCLPVCSSDCLHGTCVAPDKCQCETGFGGPHCDICKFHSLLNSVAKLVFFFCSLSSWFMGTRLSEQVFMPEQFNL